MSTNEITCELVDAKDLDTRYLTGQLSRSEAETFESHFFGCERCWGLVQRGLEVRSAFAAAGSASATGVKALPKRVPRSWWGLAAASIAVAVIGLWQLGTRQGESPETVYRGSSDSFTLAATSVGRTLAADWIRQPAAETYRVRLYRPDGTLVYERETADTSISLPFDSIAAPGGAQLFWQVHALDDLRSPVAASELTETRLPPSGR